MNHSSAELDVLFVSDQPCWPLDQGFRLHGYQMIESLRRMNVRVGAASIEPLPEDAPAEFAGVNVTWPRAAESDIAALKAGWGGPLSRLRHRLTRFEGLSISDLAGVIQLVDRYRPRAVIGLGLRGPYLLAALGGRSDIQRIWYAADELVRFHLSCMRYEAVRDWPARLVRLAHHAALERLLVPGVAGAIAVSPAEARWLHDVAGARRVETIRNGVDQDYFKPGLTSPRPRSLIFWGRLDFEPNIDAVRWFAGRVWPRVRSRWPDAVWTIIGKGGGGAVESIRTTPGVELLGAVDDLRPHVAAASAAILPMRCGGGIKNKLLEAAAMGKAILASPRAVDGLIGSDSLAPVAGERAGVRGENVRPPNAQDSADVITSFHPSPILSPQRGEGSEAEQPPWLLCTSPDAWLNNLNRLWTYPDLADDLSRRAVSWVRRHHTWDAAAVHLLDWLEMFPAPRRWRLSTARPTPAPLRQAA